ncbi:MAG: hypothetical protein EBR73_16690 [Rhodobacteraceae bacterium]|nr:hypothetical protein [Paracoccaceae bacterium]
MHHLIMRMLLLLMLIHWLVVLRLIMWHVTRQTQQEFMQMVHSFKPTQPLTHKIQLAVMLTLHSFKLI